MVERLRIAMALIILAAAILGCGEKRIYERRD